MRSCTLQVGLICGQFGKAGNGNEQEDEHEAKFSKVSDGMASIGPVETLECKIS